MMTIYEKIMAMFAKKGNQADESMLDILQEVESKPFYTSSIKLYAAKAVAQDDYNKLLWALLEEQSKVNILDLVKPQPVFNLQGQLQPPVQEYQGNSPAA